MDLEMEARDGVPMICLKIRDHGIGMTPQQLEKVFTRFYRADASGNISGTGLGMSIVKEIVDLHRGHISVDSVMGEGTRVCVCLPVLAYPTAIADPA
jgi:signal transduction histidine kinase